MKLLHIISIFFLFLCTTATYGMEQFNAQFKAFKEAINDKYPSEDTLEKVFRFCEEHISKTLPPSKKKALRALYQEAYYCMRYKYVLSKDFNQWDTQMHEKMSQLGITPSATVVTFQIPLPLSDDPLVAAEHHNQYYYSNHQLSLTSENNIQSEREKQDAYSMVDCFFSSEFTNNHDSQKIQDDDLVIQEIQSWAEFLSDHNYDYVCDAALEFCKSKLSTPLSQSVLMKIKALQKYVFDQKHCTTKTFSLTITNNP